MAKKTKKESKKNNQGQLGKKKETAREKMIGQSIGYRSVSYTHLTLPTTYGV